MKIAVPWSLSHYIPFNGFHPLYRALFDHAPADINLIAWDNVKLYRHFAHDLSDRERVLSLASSCQRERGSIPPGSVAGLYAHYPYPPDEILNKALPGELELLHTAPFPSLTRPFVFHCESFAPVFFPCAQQGLGKSGNHDELRFHYQRIFSDPLCQGIYSHIPETLDSFSRFFSHTAIEKKLFGSKIGLSKQSVNPGMFPARKSVDKPRFLFIDAAHQAPESFFDRGGHIVLRFWKTFRSAARDGMLILHCERPDDHSLARHGVDPAFINSEMGRGLFWAEEHLANHEINALMADAHFYLLPGASLDSASILRAMTLGTVPVVTDTVGTSVYVTDRDHAIVLKGVREIWQLNPSLGGPVDRDKRMSNIAASLVTQLVNRVLQLLDSTEALLALSHRAAERAHREFSGEAFALEFWNSVTAKARQSRASPNPSSNASKLTASLQNCTLTQEAWSRVFESSAQPMPRLDTGSSTVAELGGAVVNLTGRPPKTPSEWSVFARYYSADAPETIFAETLVELRGVYLTSADHELGPGSKKLVRSISAALMKFPTIHAMASRSYRIARKAWGVAKNSVSVSQFTRAGWIRKTNQLRDEEH